jgi:hypothetical protein
LRPAGFAIAAGRGDSYVDRHRMIESLGEEDKQWEERGKEYDLHCPTVWERFDWSYMAFRALVQHIYLEYASKDKVVLIGLGGNFLMAGVPFALNVRIVAPKRVRTDRIVEEEEVDRKTAEWLLDKTDHDDSCYVHALYGKNWDDAAAYDVTFDTSVKTRADIVARIEEMIVEKEKRETPETRQILDMRALAARVKAVIFSDRQFFVPTLEVFLEKGGLVVQGVVHGPHEVARLEHAIRAIVPGTQVRFQFHLR